MSPDKPRIPRRWRAGDVWALAFLLLGLVIVLFVAATEGKYLVWTLWIAVPMLMFSLAYLFLVSALPIFLGPRSGAEPESEQPRDKGDE
jgi:amino acid transporter